MLNFYFIRDEQPFSSSPRQLKYAGGIEEEEFEMGRHLGLIEKQADYYGKFRWSSEQVSSKLFLLANCPMRERTSLQDILKQAEAAQAGLIAFGEQRQRASYYRPRKNARNRASSASSRCT